MWELFSKYVIHIFDYFFYKQILSNLTYFQSFSYQYQLQNFLMASNTSSTGFSVYIGNIPYNTNEQDIGNMFSSCGTVTNVRIVFDRETNRPKGFGFCEFQDQQGAQNAIDQMNGVELNGRALRVSWANK